MNKIYISEVNKTIYHETLKNGLNIYMLPEEYNNYHISITCKFGSTYINFKEKNKISKLKIGSAHALEHQMYKKENFNIFDLFESLGAKSNAYTSFDNTTYEVTCNKNFKEVLSIILNLVFIPYFTKENLDLEKKIIKDEIKTNKLDIFNTLENTINSNIYKYDEKKYLITGDEKQVDSLTFHDLQKAYDLFYHPENIFIVINGNFKKMEANAIIKEFFSNKSYPRFDKKTKLTKNEPIKISKKKINLISNINIPILSINYKLNKESFKKYNDFTLGLYLDAILSLLYGKSSDIYIKLYSENIINDLIDYSYTINSNNIVITINIRSFYKEEVLNQINKSITSNTFTNEDLNCYKRVATSSYLLNFNDIVKTNDLLVNDLVSGSINTNYIKSINSLNINDLNKISSLIKTNNKLEVTIKND